MKTLVGNTFGDTAGFCLTVVLIKESTPKSNLFLFALVLLSFLSSQSKGGLLFCILIVDRFRKLEKGLGNLYNRFIAGGMMTKKPYFFVLMPFAEKWKQVYDKGIKGTCEKAGCRCERVDEQSFSQPILEHIYKQIKKADVIVAELSENNTNVFYEVGYAHANH